MSSRWSRTGRKAPWAALTAALAMSALAACGSGGASASANGLPSTIKVVITNPTTGAVAKVGTSADQGYELAVEQINKSGMLGKSKIQLQEQDTKSDPTTAATQMSNALADKNVAAVFGSVSSAEAVTQAPIAQKAGMPTVFTQAGSNGVIVGDYTYRATALMREYYPTLDSYIKQNGWKSVGILYANFVPTLADIGENTLPAMANQLGMKVTKQIGTTQTTQDYSAAINQILGSKPDVVAVLEYAAGNDTAMTELRQAGYSGPVLGTISAASGVLTAAGQAGAGVVYPSYYSSARDIPSTKKFVQDFQAKFGQVPNNYAAEAYDAAEFLARALKYANSTDHAAIKAGMAKAAKDKVNGALGSDLTWKNQELQPHGLLIRWDGTKEDLVYDSLKP